MPPATILVAVKPEPLPFVIQALDGYEHVVVHSLSETEKIIPSSGIDLFLIGILFDDSRAMELIKSVRISSTYAKAPIVAVRLMPSVHADMLRDVMSVMLATGTVNCYLEGALDEVDLAGRIRKAVEDLLPEDKRFVR